MFNKEKNEEFIFDKIILNTPEIINYSYIVLSPNNKYFFVNGNLYDV